MRLVAVFVCLTVVGGGQQPKGVWNASELTERVDSVVGDFLQRSPGYTLGWDEKACRMAGDQVAVAITRNLRLRDLANPTKATRVLSLLRFAFSEPESIADPQKSKPAVALFLVEYLAVHGADRTLRAEARDLAQKLSAISER